MHICIDCRFHKNSGIGRYIKEKVKNIIEDGSFTKYSLIIDKNEIDRVFFNSVCNSQVEIIYCQAKMYSVKEQIELPLKIPSCDVFWSMHYNAPILPIRAKEKWVTIHDVAHLAIADMLKLSFAKRLYAKMLMYSSTHFYNKIYTVSEFSKNEIIKYENIAPEKIAITYNTVDINKYYMIEDSNKLEYVKSKYSLPDKYILYVGNVKPHKNLIRLLEAYYLYKKYNENPIKLLIVGKKDGFITGIDNIKNVIDKYDLGTEIKFTGYVEDDDLPAIYSMAKLFVFPSIYEGWGIPPLEALACGCKVIASNTASIPEACGDRVEYFDPFDVMDIKDKIEKYCF